MTSIATFLHRYTKYRIAAKCRCPSPRSVREDCSKNNITCLRSSYIYTLCGYLLFFVPQKPLHLHVCTFSGGQSNFESTVIVLKRHTYEELIYSRPKSIFDISFSRQMEFEFVKQEITIGRQVR